MYYSIYLWAIIIVVIPFLLIVSKARWISFSLLVSRAEVASSNINILGFFKIALAIAILCFCPPDSLLPFIPTKYSVFSSILFMNSLA